MAPSGYEVGSPAIGFSEGTLDEPRQRQVAQELFKVGADQELIPRWIEEVTAAPKPPDASPTQEPGRATGCLEGGLMPCEDQRIRR
jgi:hypothetical protein